jgi:catalase
MKPDTLKVGCIICQGYDSNEFNEVLQALYNAKTMPKIISDKLLPVKGSQDDEQMPNYTLDTADPVLMDAIYVIGGPNLNDKTITEIKRYIQETYMHYKPLLVTKNLSGLLNPNMAVQPGVTILEGNRQVNKFINDISMHRHWDRNVNLCNTNDLKQMIKF